jgi:phosphotransferase system enzyme I (PtsI)
VREVEADGIGLFRTEFLFLNRDDLPDEDEQFEAYRSVVQAMAGKPVTIRTLDIGADKALRGASAGSEAQSGARPARDPLLPGRAAMFLTQLRAILRASHYGKVRIMLPMLAFTARDRADAGADRAGAAATARCGRKPSTKACRSAA